ncbi:MAG: transposase [Chloroflexi bacterium]|nr:transposase [Chloroflexota bacterium]
MSLRVQHNRRSIRLEGYDYSQAGAYFVTLVTQDRELTFGAIKNDEMILNPMGELAAILWQTLPRRFPISLDECILMPNHFHGIIVIHDTRKGEAFGDQASPDILAHLPNASPLPPHGTQPGSLGAIIQNFKSVTARRINALRNTPGAPVWQRNYYEHILRDEDDLARVRRYIAENPLRWALDTENPLS